MLYEIGRNAQELNIHTQTVQSSGLDINTVFKLNHSEVNPEDKEALFSILESCKEKSLNDLCGWDKSLGEYFEETYVFYYNHLLRYFLIT